MADITMCTNILCDRFENCYRAMATPSNWQSWGSFSPDEGGECKSFMLYEGNRASRGAVGDRQASGVAVASTKAAGCETSSFFRMEHGQ